MYRLPYFFCVCTPSVFCAVPLPRYLLDIIAVTLGAEGAAGGKPKKKKHKAQPQQQLPAPPGADAAADASGTLGAPCDAAAVAQWTLRMQVGGL